MGDIHHYDGYLLQNFVRCWTANVERGLGTVFSEERGMVSLMLEGLNVVGVDLPRFLDRLLTVPSGVLEASEQCL